MPEQDTFAFIIHPVSIKRDAVRKVPIARFLTEGQINYLSRFFPPLYLSEVTGIQSTSTGNRVQGWLVACPYTPPTMLSLPVETVYNKIVATAQKAQKLGAKIVGLGAYTSVVGDAGVTIASRLDVPVTTGDSYTVYIAAEAVRAAAAEMDIAMDEAHVAVVGATGAIGKTCAELLAREVAQLTLIGRRQQALDAVKERCDGHAAQVTASTEMDAIYEADLILTVTSAVHAVIEPGHLKPGSVVCDVARPRDVSRRVLAERDDVLVIEGGMVQVPGEDADFHFNFGFPPQKAFACMAETIALAVDGRYESYTLGKDITIEQALTIGRIAEKHGFRLAGFRTFELPVTAEQIARVRARAHETRKSWVGSR